MKPVWSELVGASGDGALPGALTGCGARLPWKAPMALCAHCMQRLRRPASPGCRGCGRPLVGDRTDADQRDRCAAAAVRRRRHGEDLAAAYLYLPPLVGVVRALKFARADHLGALPRWRRRDRFAGWESAWTW